MSLARHEQAAARGRIYGLLAKLLIRGLDAESLAQLQALDGWLLPEPRPSLDELAAAHHSCFHLGVFPYAGVFRVAGEASGAGACTDQVRRHYLRAGFNPRLDELAADHLGIELAYLSFLAAATAEALADERPRVAARLEQLTAEFLDECVLSWLPVLVAAARDQPAPDASAGFWPGVLHATLELCAEHRQSLASERILDGRLARIGEGPDPLDDPRTGLRELAVWLLRPADSGVFLTRADIAILGREQALPRGFGSRQIMLRNLLESAAEYGQLAELSRALDALLSRRDAALAQLADELELTHHLTPWRAAIRRSRGLAKTLAQASEQAESGTPWTSKPSTTTRPAP